MRSLAHTEELAAVESKIAAVTHRLEVLDERINTGVDELDRNAQDERRDLQRQRDQLELQRDQFELRFPVPIFIGTLSKAQAQALMNAHGIQARLDQEDHPQVLLQNNPTLAGAYITLELIAKHGKP